MARFKFGCGRVGEAKFAADIKVGIAGRRDPFTALVLEADIAALLRKGALEALGGHLDFLRDVPLMVHEMGHYVLSVVAFG